MRKTLDSVNQDMPLINGYFQDRVGLENLVPERMCSEINKDMSEDIRGSVMGFPLATSGII